MQAFPFVRPLLLAGLLLTGDAAAGAAPAADALGAVRAELAQALDPILADPALRRAKVGVHVVRLTDGAELYTRAADTLLVPASNVKILTTAAALRVLSPDYQFPTEVYGALKPSGQVVGDLVVKGYGDPYLVPERVWYLASRLYFLGVREILGDIVIDDAYFDGPRMGNGSEQDRTSNAYMAPAGAVSVGFNALMVHILPGASVGDDARVMLEPLSSYATVQGQVRTVATGRSSISVEVVPQGGRSVVKLSGRIGQNDPGRGYWRRIDEPPLFAGEVLRSALGQVGVQVRGKVRRGALPPESPQLLSLTSPRLAELIGPLNKYSNNFMATQVAFAMGAKRFGAPGTWDKARQTFDEFLTGEVGLAKGSYTLSNASGLHDVNRLTPRQMVQVLGYMYGQPQLYPEFIGSLAVAAGSGTLQDRMADTHAAHLLRAKTGTLSMASALSGYVTAKSGEPLAFSIIVNGYQGIEGVWAAQDRFGSALAGTNMSLREAGTALTTSEDDGLAAPDGARP